MSLAWHASTVCSATHPTTGRGTHVRFAHWHEICDTQAVTLPANPAQYDVQSEFHVAPIVDALHCCDCVMPSAPAVSAHDLPVADGNCTITRDRVRIAAVPQLAVHGDQSLKSLRMHRLSRGLHVP
jgi:zona occludens toxin (predicted ATPase)